MNNRGGSIPSGNGPIPSEEALSGYGIRCEHSKMPTNGELRFRLTSQTDGTAYIRTQTEGSFGWQNAHYHKGVAETYIVQKGWIVYAEVRKGQERYVEYKADELFTTEPWIAHNIYMPPGAVIHTVKHGESVPNPDKGNNDWWDDSPDVKRLQGATFGSGHDGARVRILVAQTPALEPKIEPYNEAYRHFDNLIWAVPAITAAIIAGILAAISPLLSNLNLGNQSQELVVQITGLSPATLFLLILVVTALVLFFLSFAVHRNRWHQAKNKPPASAHRWSNPQVVLLAIINCGAFAFLFMAVRVVTLTAGLQLDWLPEMGNLVVPIVVALSLTIYQNQVVLRANKEGFAAPTGAQSAAVIGSSGTVGDGRS